MSSRNFRKLCGNSLLPPDDSDGDYDPMSNHYNPRSTYDGLELSSDSDSVREHEPEDDTQEVTSSVSHGGARKKKPQKKKGKGKKSKMCYAGETSDGVSSSTDAIGQVEGQRQVARYSARNTTEELDEIDKSIMEVNALLGTPPPASPQLDIPTNCEPINLILEVHAKHLNVSNELRRLFGPDEAEEIRFRARSQPYRVRILKRVMITPTNNTLLYEFKKTGLSMSLERHEENIAYFVYDHDQDHQKMHQIYLKAFAQTFVNPDATLLGMGEYMKKMHVEPLLEIADALFRMEENSKANALIENIITYLQYVAHPSFNLSRSNVRLLYIYKENRPFHVAMLKYLYLLTNKACHRTALEIAKMLLNIDPSDPLAILFVIDTLALRAREHQWLIEAIELFSIQRRANLLFNIQYSNALAHFHVALKNKRDLSEADKYLQLAILSYPQVVPMIMECANVNEPRIQTHTLFINDPRAFGNEDLNELIMIYARLTYSRWRESQVMGWFLKNAIEVAENFNNSDEVRAQATEQAVLRHNLFQAWPTEISRHVSVLAPMSKLILETPLSHTRQPTGSSWDPTFDSGINRYEPPDFQAFLMSHLIATNGRTPHLAAFDPVHEMSMSQNMPAIENYNAAGNFDRSFTSVGQAEYTQNDEDMNETPLDLSEQQVEQASKTVDTYYLEEMQQNTENPSRSQDPEEPAPSASPQNGAYVFNIHDFEVMPNPEPLNGIIPNRSNPNIAFYPINLLNINRDVVYDSFNDDDDYVEHFENIHLTNVDHFGNNENGNRSRQN